MTQSTQGVPLESKKVVSVEESLLRGGTLDNTQVFARLSAIMSELRARVLGAFELTASPENAIYGSYRAPNGSCRGSLATFSGPEITWLVDSWMGNPETGFTNLHFNTWLGPKSRVPHLAIVLGTVPDVFFYFDYVPRTDLTVDLAYLDKYYEALNEDYVAFHDDKRMKPFVSASVYMRQAISPSGLCFTCERSDENIEFLRNTAHRMMDRWLGWLKAGDPVVEKDQAALAARDLFLRRAVAERDPANSLAERLLGKEEMQKLVGLLWGTAGTAGTTNRSE